MEMLKITKQHVIGTTCTSFQSKLISVQNYDY